MAIKTTVQVYEQVLTMYQSGNSSLMDYLVNLPVSYLRELYNKATLDEPRLASIIRTAEQNKRSAIVETERSFGGFKR